MRPWIPAAALLLALSPLAVVHPLRVQGRSMLPALAPGQVVWVLRAWAAGAPSPGEVWLVQGPDGPVVKRVAAPPEPDAGLRVLGDNHTVSRDSRTWGPLPRTAFRGRVLGAPPRKPESS